MKPFSFEVLGTVKVVRVVTASKDLKGDENGNRGFQRQSIVTKYTVAKYHASSLSVVNLILNQ